MQMLCFRFSGDEIEETQRKEGLSPVGRLRGVMKGSRGVKVGRTRWGKGLNRSVPFIPDHRRKAALNMPLLSDVTK